MFAERDLDTVLYGYVRSPCDFSSDSPDTGHALSGLRVEQLSYGQYRQTPVWYFTVVGDVKSEDKKTHSATGMQFLYCLFISDKKP